MTASASADGPRGGSPAPESERATGPQADIFEVTAASASGDAGGAADADAGGADADAGGASADAGAADDADAARALLDDLARRPLALGPAVWEVLEGLLDEPLRPLPALAGEVEVYLSELRAQASEDDAVDLGVAERLGRVVLDLLAALEGAPAAHRLLGQAAARYFVLDDDALGDTRSVTGFDDDAEVVRAALEHLGLRDLAARCP